jgi:cardiolipin synthase
MKGYLQAENIRLVYSGNNYFELLEKLIDNCKETLHFQTYIFETDLTGLKIINALKRAASRNVSVYLMIDAFGSQSFSKETAKDLLASGINFRKYAPLFSAESIYFGRRLHYKIIVADKNIALTGGINIADKYNNNSETRPWLDYAILSEGKVCEYLHILCGQTYVKQKNSSLNSWETSMHSKQNHLQPDQISFRINDWIRGRNEIHKSYIKELLKAKKSITIVASYFLPGITFRKLLVEAVKRGVEVKIILAGKSDVASVRLAEVYLYAFYLRHNIKLYEWSNSVMHGKAMIVDNEWSTIGSFNVNFLSRYISIELNTDVLDAKFASEFSAHLEKITNEGCKLIEKKILKERSPWYNQFKMWLAYYFYHILMDVTINRRGRKTQK